jgi:hypothetical protein
MEKRMNAEPIQSAAPEATEGGLSASATWAYRDHAALPARALGPKAGLLQSRRQQRDAGRPGAGAATREAVQLTTADAAVTFVLKASGSALYVERIQRRPLGTHVVQCMVFASADDFARWCDAEPLRFDDPGLHQRLCRRGREFFGGGH